MVLPVVIWMWELNSKKDWAPKHWCLQTVVLEKTLEHFLDSKEIKQVNPKRSQCSVFIGRTDAEAEAPILWPRDAKSWIIGKDPDAGKDLRQEDKWMTEDETVEWHHQLNGHEFEQALGDGEGQGSLVCSSPWGHKELNTTEPLNKIVRKSRHQCLVPNWVWCPGQIWPSGGLHLCPSRREPSLAGSPWETQRSPWQHPCWSYCCPLSWDLLHRMQGWLGFGEDYWQSPVSKRIPALAGGPVQGQSAPLWRYAAQRAVDAHHCPLHDEWVQCAHAQWSAGWEARRSRPRGPVHHLG